MAGSNDTDSKGGQEAARAAARRLRAIAEGAPVEEESPELIRMANLVASTIVSASQNAYSQEQSVQFADNLVAALTVLRFGSLFGSDPAAVEASKEKVGKFVELFEMALELSGE